MAFKLTKQEMTERAKHIGALTNGREAIDAAIEAFNATMETAREALETAFEVYETTFNEAKAWAEDIVSQANDDFADKSERWQEGDNGSAAREWIDEWEGALTDEPAIEFPEPIAVDWEQHADELEQLRTASTE